MRKLLGLTNAELKDLTAFFHECFKAPHDGDFYDFIRFVVYRTEKEVVEVLNARELAATEKPASGEN